MDAALQRQLEKFEQRARSIYAKAYRRREIATGGILTRDEALQVEETFSADKREARPWYRLKEDVEVFVESLPKLIALADVLEFERHLQKLLSSFLMTHHLGMGDDYPEDVYQPSESDQSSGGYFGELSNGDF